MSARAHFQQKVTKFLIWAALNPRYHVLAFISKGHSYIATAPSPCYIQSLAVIPASCGLLSAFLTGWCAFGHVVVSTQAYSCHAGWAFLFLPSSLKRWIHVTSQAQSAIFKREVAKQIQTALCELRINHSLIYLSLLFWSVSSSNAVHFRNLSDRKWLHFTIAFATLKMSVFDRGCIQHP